MKTLFCFGLGYTALALSRRLAREGWTITGTTTSPAGLARLQAEGIGVQVFDGLQAAAGVPQALGRASHVLVSVPPDGERDPVLALHGHDIAAAASVTWIGYLSTIGVYGDRQGGWVDETSEPRPVSDRSMARLHAEQAWTQWGAEAGKPVTLFRLAGIYGPGRSALDGVRAGTTRRIVKPGQVFNRIHVADIATVLEAAMAGNGRHDIYNVADDEPAPPQEVIAHAASLLGLPVPPAVTFSCATLSPMAASFYGENKRVRNDRIKNDLGVRLAHPDYRVGLQALLAAGV